jgi:hypothetical protein
MIFRSKTSFFDPLKSKLSDIKTHIDINNGQKFELGGI